MLVRHCKVCREDKPASEFYLNKNGHPARRECKKCMCARLFVERTPNRKGRKVVSAEELAARAERQKARQERWRQANMERWSAARDAAAKRYRQRNRGKVNARTSQYRANIRLATLPGYDRWIDAIYETAADLGLQVDHVMPIRGKNFCGLHVPWNMQLLSKSRNSAKRNLTPAGASVFAN